MPAGQPAANRDVALITAGASSWYCGLAFRFPDSYFNSDSAPKVGINLQPGKKKSRAGRGITVAGYERYWLGRNGRRYTGWREGSCPDKPRRR